VSQNWYTVELNIVFGNFETNVSTPHLCTLHSLRCICQVDKLLYKEISSASNTKAIYVVPCINVIPKIAGTVNYVKK
jgi:hypothetical protein